MNTPPGQIHSPQIPITPKHGANFLSDTSPVRRSTRLKKATPVHVPSSQATLSPPPSSPLDETSISPRRSPRNVKRATFALPEDHESSEEEEVKTRRSRTQTNTSFGLHTPAKTPKKRKVPNKEITTTAKVLFPSTSKSTSTSRASLEEPPKTPVRKTPRTKRAIRLDHKSDSDDIRIFTDSSARRPRADLAEDNPFLSLPGQETRSSKRKRQQMADRIDGKSLDAGRSDGMYYTFRGKKVFRSFKSLPDAGSRGFSDAEDLEDEGDVGLKPSQIKPRLLFPSAGSTKSRHSEAEKNDPIVEDPLVDTDVDEEAETDIDEAASVCASVKKAPIVFSATKKTTVTSTKKVTTKARKPVSRMTPDSDDDGEILVKEPVMPSTPKRGCKNRVSASQSLFDEDEDDDIFSRTPGNMSLFDKEPVVEPKRGMKRKIEFGLDTPPRSTHKKSRRMGFA